MCSTFLPHELYSLSFDSIEEDSNNAAWSGLVKNLNHRRLEQLKYKFDEHLEDGQEYGFDKNEFLNVICEVFGNSRYSLQSNSLFDAIVGGGKPFITWSNFLDFLADNAAPRTYQSVFLDISKIECAPHMNKETIVKIVLIETDQYFCYTVISKHGRVGLYDGNLNFLTSYQVIMTREDISRSDDERRRRNRWVTDAVYCSDVLMLIVTNSARSIMIYEASGLKHIPYWLIIGVPDIIEVLAYKRYGTSNSCEENEISVLFCGDSNGDYKFLKFLQPSEGLLRRRNTDTITLYYWVALKHETLSVEIENWRKIHGSAIRQIEYSVADSAIISCSNDPSASIVKTFFSPNKKKYILKMEKAEPFKQISSFSYSCVENWKNYRWNLKDSCNQGCNCFSLDNIHKLLVTGSNNGIIRLWNAVIVSKPIAIFAGHQEHIVDIITMSNLEYILSFSRDGILKLWDIETSKCLQTLKTKYPSFRIQGKSIEFGKMNIYPGPKRQSTISDEFQDRSKNKEYFGIADAVEKSNSTSDSTRTRSDIWERSCILVTCCNHIATIKLTFDDVEIENSSGMPLSPPPPLQNSVLIPSNWRIAEKTEDFSLIDCQQGGDIEDISKKSREAQFIMDKDLLGEQYNKYDINFKIAKLECKKLQMQHHVERNAPYLALDIPDIEELTLSPNLPIPKKKKIKDIVDNTKRILADASMRNQIFSESSSSRSKSSRSSIVEFPY